MGQRLQLHDRLKQLLGSDDVYFQPPPDLAISYPCIVYNRSNIRSSHGDNAPYQQIKEYTVTVIDQDPDSTIPDKVSKLPQCTFDRHFATEGLNHDVFILLF